MKKLIAQFMKFGIVGVIAFLIDYGLMVALTEFFGVPYLISNTISFTVSVVFNYVASMRYVFEPVSYTHLDVYKRQGPQLTH